MDRPSDLHRTYRRPSLTGVFIDRRRPMQATASSSQRTSTMMSMIGLAYKRRRAEALVRRRR